MITRRRFLGGGMVSLLALQYSEIFERIGNGHIEGVPGDDLSVRKAIALRRTVRSFTSRMLREDQLMGVLWAAQGVTDRIGGLRAVPSAGALYPLEVYAFLGAEAVAGMKQGVYRYRPDETDTRELDGRDMRPELAEACASQLWLAQAPVSLVISAVYSRSTGKYGERGIRYSHIEAGCASQNVFLMAISLGLEAGIVEEFDDDKVRELTGAEADSSPLLVMPVGYGA